MKIGHIFLWTVRRTEGLVNRDKATGWTKEGVVQSLEDAKFWPFPQSVHGRVWVSTGLLSAGYRRLCALEPCDLTENLSTHLLILPNLRMNGAIPPLPPFDFLACIGVTFISVITLLIRKLNWYPHNHILHSVVTLCSLHLSLVAACAVAFSYVKISTRFAFCGFLPRFLPHRILFHWSGLVKIYFITSIQIL